MPKTPNWAQFEHDVQDLLGLDATICSGNQFHGDRNCPYCGREQFWSPSSDAYCHADNLNLHCDEERLAGWDLSEAWKRTSHER